MHNGDKVTMYFNGHSM